MVGVAEGFYTKKYSKKWYRFFSGFFIAIGLVFLEIFLRTAGLETATVCCWYSLASAFVVITFGLELPQDANNIEITIVLQTNFTLDLMW